MPAKAIFITQDEVDGMLTDGNGVSVRKLKIYAYFMEGHTAKERVEFLKQEYGKGGRSSFGYDLWHNAKGLQLKRGDDASGEKGYDTLWLSWNQVQWQIGELINEGRYLSEAEMDTFLHREPFLSTPNANRTATPKTPAEPPNLTAENKTDSLPSEPASASEDDLEAAARALSYKQQARTKESADGQLSFDFGMLQGSSSNADNAEYIVTKEIERQPLSDGEELKEAIEQIKAFASRAYNNEEIDFWDLEHIPLAYTVTEDGKHEIQVEADLQKFTISKFVDGECIEKQSYQSLQEMADKALRTLAWNELVRIETSQQIETPQQIRNPQQIETPQQVKTPQQAQEQIFPQSPEDFGQMPSPLPDQIQDAAFLPITDTQTFPGNSLSSPKDKFVPDKAWTEIEGERLLQTVLELSPSQPFHKLQPHNFHITDNQLGTGGAKTKYQNNLAAIRTLKEVEQEGRLASPDEQEILS